MWCNGIISVLDVLNLVLCLDFVAILLVCCLLAILAWWALVDPYGSDLFVLGCLVCVIDCWFTCFWCELLGGLGCHACDFLLWL